MDKLKKIAINLSKKNVFIRNCLRKTMNILRKINYKIRTIGIKVDENTILFCSFNGGSYSCSPKAIYEYMSENECFKNYKFIL